MVFSNQGNIGIETQGEIATQIKAYVDAFLTEAEIPLLVMLASQHNEFRKPNLGMWDYLESICDAHVNIDKSKSFFIGSASGHHT